MPSQSKLSDSPNREADEETGFFRFFLASFFVRPEVCCMFYWINHTEIRHNDNSVGEMEKKVVEFSDVIQVIWRIFSISPDWIFQYICRYLNLPVTVERHFYVHSTAL